MCVRVMYNCELRRICGPERGKEKEGRKEYTCGQMGWSNALEVQERGEKSNDDMRKVGIQ